MSVASWSAATKQAKTPCCAGGFFRANPAGEIYCSQCQRIFTPDELMDAVGLRDAAGRMPLPGNTYPVKDELKALGGFWDPQARIWMIPQARFAEAQAIVARGPSGASTTWTPSTPVQSVPWQNKYRKKKPYEERLCWECGQPFSETQAEIDDGSWDGRWCGCTDAPKRKQVRPPW